MKPNILTYAEIEADPSMSALLKTFLLDPSIMMSTLNGDGKTYFRGDEPGTVVVVDDREFPMALRPLKYHLDDESQGAQNDE